LTKEHWDWF